MAQFVFRCQDDHQFKAEGDYSQFDMARPCAVKGCGCPAFMLLDGMASLGFALAADDRLAYAQHNVTFTGEAGDGGEGSIGFTPNSHADQCQCEKCSRHRRRALVTETADKGKDVHICL